jgi:hypothetical protein
MTTRDCLQTFVGARNVYEAHAALAAAWERQINRDGMEMEREEPEDSGSDPGSEQEVLAHLRMKVMEVAEAFAVPVTADALGFTDTFTWTDFPGLLAMLGVPCSQGLMEVTVAAVCANRHVASPPPGLHLAVAACEAQDLREWCANCLGAWAVDVPTPSSWFRRHNFTDRGVLLCGVVPFMTSESGLTRVWDVVQSRSAQDPDPGLLQVVHVTLARMHELEERWLGQVRSVWCQCVARAAGGRRGQT